MLRMNASASIQNSNSSVPSRARRSCPSARPRLHSAASTSRSKRTCSVWVGVKAVKSCVPTSASAQRSSRPG